MTAEPFSILGEDRPSRWLITCDHATNRVPDWIGGGDLGLPPEDMARHIAYDVGAAGLASRLAALMDASAIFSDFSRLVIDPNRGEDDPTLLMRLYDGTVIPTNRLADAAERQRRLDRLHRPYHAALGRLADDAARGAAFSAAVAERIAAAFPHSATPDGVRARSAWRDSELAALDSHLKTRAEKDR